MLSISYWIFVSAHTSRMRAQQPSQRICLLSQSTSRQTLLVAKVQLAKARLFYRTLQEKGIQSLLSGAKTTLLSTCSYSADSRARTGNVRV